MSSKTTIEFQGKPFTIECEDIFLREYLLEDLDGICKITHEPEIKQFLPGWDVSREQRREWLTDYEMPENRRFLQAVQDGGDVGELRKCVFTYIGEIELEQEQYHHYKLCDEK